MPRRKQRWLGPIVLLAAGMVMGWWLARQGLPLLQPALVAPSPSAAGDIRQVDFRNFTYASSCISEDGRLTDIQVRDGEFKRERQYDSLFFSVLSVNYGDLTGDGQSEAAIAVNCNTGGTGQFSEGLVYAMRSGAPALIARIEGGDRAYGGIAGLSVENGKLRVERYATDEDGPACCPRYIETTQLRWDGNRLIETGNVTRRKVSNE